MSGADFETALQALVSREASAAHGDADRMGAMIELQARALGFTVALASGGSPAGIDAFMPGVEGYIHGEAVQKAPLVRFMTEAKRK